VGEAGDITDYFVKLGGSVDDLFSKYAKPYPERIDTSQFSQISSEQLLDTLGLTIKYDAENKLATSWDRHHSKAPDNTKRFEGNRRSCDGYHSRARTKSGDSDI
jgi:hypothetical protein